MKNKIELGDKVKCIYTGFKGIVVAKIEFINGCIQFEVAGKVDKDNKIPEGTYIDQHSLEVVTPKKKESEPEDTGGRNHKSIKVRGY